jgi:hypothetical protein
MVKAADPTLALSVYLRANVPSKVLVTTFPNRVYRVISWVYVPKKVTVSFET